jgi:hypothetical protein
VSDKYLNRAEVLNFVYTLQADRMADAYARLKAEVERLTKAGDEMHEQATNTFQPHSLRLAMEAWNDAKKGGQP